MAHQQHNIPWTLLASNLKWYKGGLRNGRSQSSAHEITNLQPCGNPSQGKEIAYFVEAFARTIDEHSNCERKKFPETYDPPTAEDIILDDRIVKKITPTVRRLRNYVCDSHCPSGTCWLMYHGKECHCIPIPDEARIMSGFLRSYTPNPCYSFFDVNRAAFFQLQLVETLVLYGEMDAVLRICAHPEVGLKDWWLLSECYCNVRHDIVFIGHWKCSLWIVLTCTDPFTGLRTHPLILDGTSFSKMLCSPISASTYSTASQRRGTRYQGRPTNRTIATPGCTNTCYEKAPRLGRTPT